MCIYPYSAVSISLSLSVSLFHFAEAHCCTHDKAKVKWEARVYIRPIYFAVKVDRPGIIILHLCIQHLFNNNSNNKDDNGGNGGNGNAKNKINTLVYNASSIIYIYFLDYKRFV